MLVLYEHPLSTYAQKLKISLREKGVEFESRLPTGIGTGSAVDEFARVSPRGEVPALVHDGNAIFDSTVILEYIEDVWPEPAMLPSTAAERARVRMIEDIMDTHVEAIGWGLGELFFFERATGELRDMIVANAREQVQSYHGWLESQLGDRDWFNGDAFGWGDLSVIPYVNGLAGFELAPKEGSKLADWRARANDRPSVSQTEAESRASLTGMSGVGDAIRAGLFKRQYRDHRLEWMIKSGGLQVVLDGLSAENIRFTDPFEG